MPLAAGRKLFRKLEECNDSSIAETGDLDVSALADLIEAALEDQITRRGVMLAMAEYLGTALDGGTIDLRTWKPLARLIPRTSSRKNRSCL